MVTRPMLWPGEEAGFPFGSDSLGRDLAAGIFHGARVSLSIGIAATLAALFLGIVAGAFAGYHGGRVDDILMRCTESFQTVPPFLLTIVIVTLLHPSLVTIILAISLVSWPPVARLVRVEFMTRTSTQLITRTPISKLKSRWKIASEASRPSPGQAKTVSISTAPPMIEPTCSPTMVTIGRSAFRKTCRHATVPSESPLAWAVRT